MSSLTLNFTWNNLLNGLSLWCPHVCTARYNPLSWGIPWPWHCEWPAPGVGAHIGCVSAGLGVTVSSVWPQSRGMPCTQIRGRLREPDPGLPWVGISSILGLPHITFPLIWMSGTWNILNSGGYLCAFLFILLFAVLNRFLQFLPTMLMTKVTGSIHQSIKFNNSIPNFISLFSK